QRSEASLRTTFERLGSGMRINRAVDDAAGLAVASALDARSRIYTQAIRNVNDGISLLNIAEGGISQMSDIIGRIRELATQAANGTFSAVQRITLDREADLLVDEFNRLTESTFFN